MKQTQTWMEKMTTTISNSNELDTSFLLTWEESFIPRSGIRDCIITCTIFMILCLVTSTLSRNYSQVDKLWSITPMIYAWRLAIDSRTILMAIIVSIWSIRLTYNFNRRGGYTWPPWKGEEDYRWSYVQTHDYIPFLRNRVVFFIFNIVFISIYQHILLLSLVAPSMLSYTVAKNQGSPKLNLLDWFVSTIIIMFVIVESIADNQQFAFQSKKYRQIKLGMKPTNDFVDGFCQSGLFRYLRKPNYAAEQAIWISYYFYSVAATNGIWFNWSVIGGIQVVALFHMTGNLTEHITVLKYPAYSLYMKRVPRYIPNPFSAARSKTS